MDAQTADTLTFFVWADTHFGYEPRFGPADYRWQALLQMNWMVGLPYPPEIGGVVGAPDCLLACGDFVNGGGDGERNLAYYLNALRQTDVPSFEAIGNHEIAHACAVDYVAQRHGGQHYSFGLRGVHFVSLRQEFDAGEQVEPLDQEQLGWLADDLETVDPGAPVVIFAHDRLDKQGNADDIFAAISKANVVLLLSGHTHGKRLPDGIGPHGLHHYRWHGIPGSVAGHVRNHPIDPLHGRTFLVVRITLADVVVAPWRWDLSEWARGQGWGKEEPEHMIFPR